MGNKMQVGVELAKIADMEYFKGLRKGAVVRLYLESSRIPSFTWTHDRVERDLVYGSIQFEGYSDQFPVQAYISYNGSQAALGCNCFYTASEQHKDIHLPHGSLIFTDRPLPSQIRPKTRPVKEDLKLARISSKELSVMDRLQGQLQAAGFDLGGFDLAKNMRLSDAHARSGIPCDIEFSLEQGSVEGHVSIRKHKPGGLFSRPAWYVCFDDDSYRQVQPGGWLDDGISIVPTSATLFERLDFDSIEAVSDAILRTADELVTRNT
tara:strand:- start:173 stop:967 length:795 start_codon:yes stop_codon:yes gene_type:complete